MSTMPSIAEQLRTLHPVADELPVGIPSMADQVRAAAAAALAARIPPLPSSAVGKSRGEAACRARAQCLRLLLTVPDATIPLLQEHFPDTTRAQWAWVTRTLIDRGHAEQISPPGYQLRIRITDAGRAAATQPDTGAQ